MQHLFLDANKPHGNNQYWKWLFIVLYPSFYWIKSCQRLTNAVVTMVINSSAADNIYRTPFCVGYFRCDRISDVCIALIKRQGLCKAFVLQMNPIGCEGVLVNDLMMPIHTIYDRFDCNKNFDWSQQKLNTWTPPGKGIRAQIASWKTQL